MKPITYEDIIKYAKEQAETGRYWRNSIETAETSDRRDLCIKQYNNHFCQIITLHDIARLHGADSEKFFSDLKGYL